MEYSIDVAFPTTFTANNMQLHHLELIAEECNTSSIYSSYEIEGGKQIDRNQCIMTAKFNKKSDLINFIKKIKRCHKVYIECIYEDDITCRIIYASKQYQKYMNKSEVKEYIKRKKINNDMIIL